jgi:hypothetical protein
VASSSEPRLEHACRAPAWKIHDRRGQRTLDLPLDLGELCARPLIARSPDAHEHSDDLQARVVAPVRRKLPDDRTVLSPQNILVVSSSKPRIEHYRREQGGWKSRDLSDQGTLRLPALEVTLDLADRLASVPNAQGSAGR